MAVSWTAEQQKVIDARGKNLLVSAAAGSGKTAVLVERIVKIITDKERPVDIDRLLVVTFTNAAAAEMRERIGAALEKELESNPGDAHLMRQLALLHAAQITTIDSFCLYVVRNHFHEIALEPNFRIGDEGELKLLREDVLKKTLEENYENPTERFLAFVEGYAPGRTDAALEGMILQLYEFSRSYPWPEKWLDTCEQRGREGAWEAPLLAGVRAMLSDVCRLMREALSLTLAPDGPRMYESAVRSDLEQYEAFDNLTTFGEYYGAFCGLNYERLASSRGFDGDMRKAERVKELRDTAKDVIKKLRQQYFFCPEEKIAEQQRRTAQMTAEAVRLTKQFSEAFAREKRGKNLVDFHDLEHFALEILVDGETGKAKKTAEEFRDTFEELMIDEYQDSNGVQEALLRAVSREERGENNIFMVGDVKQSIYRFRLARPELFMEKYDTYPTTDCGGRSLRIDLHKNFRSRGEVLSCVNDIFAKIMARDLGNVQYDADAALYPGAVYPEAEDETMFAPELLLLDGGDELLLDDGVSGKKELEARLVARRIQNLMETQKVTDKATGELRPLRYADIVILLRSLSGQADQMTEILQACGIPAHAVSASGYFSATEVQTVLSMLRILDNPRQDIPLAAVLRSPMAGMTDEELAALRLFRREAPFHEAVLALAERPDVVENPEEAEQSGGADGMDGALKSRAYEKLRVFYEKYKKLRRLVPDTPIHELIQIVLRETGYGAYAAAMPAGDRRKANLDMLIEKAAAYENTSYKGLFHFVRYIDELHKYDVDFGEADTVGENEDVVRIMSIHKSKGLEFPVVILAGLGRNFNRQDTRNKMVLHPELGVGFDDVDAERRVKTPTVGKRAIAMQIDLENLGEELRVLYVALTRAKEKLILTGSLKDAPEKLEKLRGTATWENPENPGDSPSDGAALLYLTRARAATYLDWLLPALLSYGEKYDVRVVGAKNLVAGEIGRSVRREIGKRERTEQIRNADEALVERISEKFGQTYPYPADLSRKNKYSVSELKHRAMREKFEREQEETVPAFLEETPPPTIPRFVRKERAEREKLPAENAREGSGAADFDADGVSRGALRGTAMHRVMECYDFDGGQTAEEQIAAMEADGRLQAEYGELVRPAAVERFVKSGVGRRMAAAQRAGALYREKPFVMGFTAGELAAFGFGEENFDGAEGMSADAEEDLTLIQGIIDVFWIEADKIALLDYKTDRVQTEKELTDRYAAQIALYAEALNRVFAGQGLRVKERYLYSFCLERLIKVEE